MSRDVEALSAMDNVMNRNANRTASRWHRDVIRGDEDVELQTWKIVLKVLGALVGNRV